VISSRRGSFVPVRGVRGKVWGPALRPTPRAGSRLACREEVAAAARPHLRSGAGSGQSSSTPPPSLPRAVHHSTTVRQLAIKPLERERRTVEKYLTVSETAEYLNTSSGLCVG
jgi:hypothetical protein